MIKCNFNCGDTELDKMTCQCYNDYMREKSIIDNNECICKSDEYCILDSNSFGDTFMYCMKCNKIRN